MDLIVVTLALLAVLYWGHHSYDFYEASVKCARNFNYDILANAERIYRLETNHFKSKQYILTRSAGMEATTTKFPYGWTMFEPYWTKYPYLRPVGVTKLSENITTKPKIFINFLSVYQGLFCVCEFLRTHNNNPGAWFSKDPVSQTQYNEKIKYINPKITNAIYGKI